jgi:hypothetical protein
MEKPNKDSGMNRTETGARKREKADPAYVLAAVAIWAMVAYGLTRPVQSAPIRLAGAAPLCAP